MEVWELLSKIQKELKAPKSQYNDFGNYNYRSCEDILNAVKPLLCEGAFVNLMDEVVLIGDRYYVKADASLRLEGNVIRSTAYARESESKKGMDAAQLTGACSSYARKYALSGLFAIDDTKDVDTMDNTKNGNSSNNSSKKQEKPKARETPKKGTSSKAKKEMTPTQRRNEFYKFISKYAIDGHDFLSWYANKEGKDRENTELLDELVDIVKEGAFEALRDIYVESKMDSGSNQENDKSASPKGSDASSRGQQNLEFE